MMMMMIEKEKMIKEVMIKERKGSWYGSKVR